METLCQPLITRKITNVLPAFGQVGHWLVVWRRSTILESRDSPLNGVGQHIDFRKAFADGMTQVETKTVNES